LFYYVLVEDSKIQEAVDDRKNKDNTGEFSAKIDMPPKTNKQSSTSSTKTTTATAKKTANKESLKLDKETEKSEEEPKESKKQKDKLFPSDFLEEGKGIYYPSDIFSSIRRIQVLMPTDANGFWANSMFSMPSLTFLLLL